MKTTLLALSAFLFSISALAGQDSSSTDARCTAPGMSLLDTSNCYYDALETLLGGAAVPASVQAYCHSESGGACDDLNGLSQTACMNECAYHQVAAQQ
jgi:hypothetical protein